MTIIDAQPRTRPNEYLLPGRVVGAGRGQKFLITGVRSGVNYAAVEVLPDGTFGQEYNLRRSNSFADFGQQNELLEQFLSGKGKILQMGSVVRIKAPGKPYNERLAIIAEVKRDLYILAIPGMTSIKTRYSGVEVVEASGTWVLNNVD